MHLRITFSGIKPIIIVGTSLLFILLLVTAALAGSAPVLPIDQPLSTLKTPGASRLSAALTFQFDAGKISGENRPLIRVKVNDLVSATFLLDTGFNATVISDKFAKRLKDRRIPISIQGKPYTLDGKRVFGVVLSKMSLGGFICKDSLVCIVAEKHIAPSVEHIDGILGLDLLRHFDYLFDFPLHQVTMFSQSRLNIPSDGSAPRYITEGLTRDEVTALGFANAKSAELIASSKDGLTYVYVQCGNKGKSGGDNLLLDTGGQLSTISSSLAQQLDLKPFTENIGVTAYSGAGSISSAPVDQIQVGNLTLNEQMIAYSDQSEPGNSVPLCFGMDIMAKYKVLMDFTAQKVYFKPMAIGSVPLTITIKSH